MCLQRTVILSPVSRARASLGLRRNLTRSAVYILSLSTFSCIFYEGLLQEQGAALSSRSLVQLTSSNCHKELHVALPIKSGQLGLRPLSSAPWRRGCTRRQSLYEVGASPVRHLQLRYQLLANTGPVGASPLSFARALAVILSSSNWLLAPIPLLPPV